MTKPLLYFQQRCRGGLRPPPTTTEAPPLPTRVSTAGLPSLNSHSLGNEAIFCHQRHKALTNEDGMCSWLQAQALPASATNSAPSLKLRCIEQQATGTSEDAGSAVLSPPCARVCLQMQLPELWVGLGWVLGAPKWGLQELDGVWEGCRASSTHAPAAGASPARAPRGVATHSDKIRSLRVISRHQAPPDRDSSVSLIPLVQSESP